jgi:crotonobetainyl-CoA:carnitine CoA-transferase CaiB-like acyl-CoA transferase
VETDLFSATLGSLINVGQSVLMTGVEAQRFGNAHPQIVPYRTFEASDGAFVLGVGTDRQFERLAALLARPDWVSDERYRTNPARVANRGALEAELAAIFQRDTREAWVARCRAADIPAGPVRGPLEALRSETAAALRSVLETSGVAFVASPVRVEGRAQRLEFPPALDADGERIRREFDLPPS